MTPKQRIVSYMGILVTVVLVTLMLAPSFVFAQTARGIKLIPEFTDIVIAKGDDARLSMKVLNTGKEGEFIDLQISTIPRGWEARFTDFSFNVRALYVAAGKEGEISFRAKPPADVTVGDYAFQLKAVTQDGLVQDNLKITIGIQAEGATTDKIKMVTLYTSQRTPAGTTIQYNLDLTNEAKADRTYNLFLSGVPPLWTSSIEPAFEKKQISNISLKAGETKGVNLILTPPDRQAPGEFTFTFRAESGSVRDTLELKLEVSGSYDIILTTPTGRLNADAIAGQESVMTIWIGNTGTAEVKGISFSSTKPDGWDIKFEPDKIDNLAARDIKEISVKIKPPDKTIAGDYVISLNALGERSSSTKEIRVTVSTPTKWGAIGVGIVVVVIAGLVGVFVRLGRR